MGLLNMFFQDNRVDGHARFAEIKTRKYYFWISTFMSSQYIIFKIKKYVFMTCCSLEHIKSYINIVSAHLTITKTFDLSLK